MLEPSRVPLISFTDSFNACSQKFIETLYHDFFFESLTDFVNIFLKSLTKANIPATLLRSFPHLLLVSPWFWNPTKFSNTDMIPSPIIEKNKNDELRMRVNENRFSHWKRWRYQVGITDNSMTHTCSMSADKLVMRARSRGLWTQSPTPSEGPTEPTLYLFT